VILFASCSRNTNDNFIEVIIDNNLETSIFFKDLNLTAVTSGENEKRYYLSTPLFVDTSSIRMHGPFEIDNEIIGNSRGIIKSRKFTINNDKFSHTIGQDGKVTENIIANFYSERNIIFLFYFLTKSSTVETYDEYKRAIKDNGFIAEGHMNEGSIIFMINEKKKVGTNEK
jgi:hypothetical protein